MKAKEHNPLQWKTLPVWLRWIIIIALINFLSFWVISVSKGGDALNGKVEDGRYFVANHGRYTEVTKEFYTCSRIQAISVWVTHSCAFLGVVCFLWHRKREPVREQRVDGIRFLPYASFDFVTTLSSAKLSAVFQRHVVPLRKRSTLQPDIYFIGRIDEKGFKCRPNTWYQNGFAPVAVGSFQSTPKGTTVIHVVFRPDCFTMCFLVMWFGILIYGLIDGILLLPSEGHEVLKGLAQLSAIVVVSWVVVMVFFWLDGKKMESWLFHMIPCQKTQG